MALKAGVGISTHRDPQRAGREAAQAALAQAGIDRCDFVMLFSTVGYDQATLLAAVRAATGHAPLSGCSGEGVIAQGTANESSHAVGVMVWRSDELTFTTGKAQGLSLGSAEIGAAVAGQLGAVPDDALALFVFPDGLTFNFDHFSEGFRRAAPSTRPLKIVGGTAGDDFTLTKTYQYHDGAVFSDGLSWALLRGRGDLFVGVTHGCVPLGEERVVTRAQDNVIFEIDHRPATKVVDEYLSPDEIDLSMRSLGIHWSLGFRAPQEIAEHYDQYIIRGVPSRDDDKGTVSLYANVPGREVRIMRRDPEKMARGIDGLAARSKQALGGKRPSAVIQLECLARGKHMFREEDKMALLERLQAPFGRDVPWIGFYTYAEIAPVLDTNYLHNYTTVLAVIY